MENVKHMYTKYCVDSDCYEGISYGDIWEVSEMLDNSNSLLSRIGFFFLLISTPSHLAQFAYVFSGVYKSESNGDYLGVLSFKICRVWLYCLSIYSWIVFRPLGLVLSGILFG